MANQEQQQSSNNTPFIIIGLVLLAVVAGGWWFYSSQTKTPASNISNAKTPTPATNQQTPGGNKQTAEDIYKNAPSGAQPPHTLGSSTATVTVEEFADFQCPTCATIHTLMKQINANYGDRIKFIFRNFPLTQIHANANNAAAAAEAAGRQGKFWDMQNLLFLNQKEWSTSPNAQEIFERYATSIGLDVEKFKSEYVSMSVRSRIMNDVARGRALTVDSTPTIFINGKKVPFEQMTQQDLSAIIDNELKTAQNSEKSNSKTEQNSNSQTTNAKKPESKEETKEAKPETK
jgi:protein-disulfide isomerase